MKDDKIFLSHILECIARIEQFSQGLDEKEFCRNILKQDAIIRELEVIGEASKNLSEDFKEKHKSIEWKLIAGFRDKLIHHYFGLELNRVWNVLKIDLPKLKNEIEDSL
jgi:uncharacterized protein with HEPN domain